MSYESKTRKHNRKLLTEHRKVHGVEFACGETIDDCVVAPGDKTDWAFYPLVEWLKRIVKRA